MNEDEFKQHLATALRLILPTFQKSEIESERSFSIKFGHHNVYVDSNIPGDRAKLGIFDILLKIDDTPIILLELKKPNLKLTAYDRDQGVSYARLTDPITPVTIITNGKDFDIYDTYSKEKIEGEILNEDFFLNRLEQASRLAKNEYKNAIITLIENDQRVMFDLFNKVSEDTFKELKGPFDDFTKPIVDHFCVPREQLPAFQQALKDYQFVVLTGDAYSGKTNLLYQFYEQALSENEAVLYINCIDFHYSIFRKLTNKIHSLLRFPVDEIKLKEWLLLHFDGATEKKITIIFDHVRYNMEPLMMADISEIIDLFKMDGNRVIICADVPNYQLLKTTSDRTLKTIVSNNFYAVKLDNFSTGEFFTANEGMLDKYKTTFAWGAVYSDAYRIPRILRLLLNDMSKDRPDHHYGILKSVPGMEILDAFKSTFQLDTESVADIIKLINALIEGIDDIEDDTLKLMARTLAIISEEKALKFLSIEKINRLIYAGYLERREVPGFFEWVLVVKLPELVAGYAVESLKNKYINWFKQDFELAYESFINICEFIPYGELVASRFIHELGRLGELDLFSNIPEMMFNDEPKVETSTTAKTLAVYDSKLDENVQFEIAAGEETKFISNSFPYLVLAHFLSGDVFGEGPEPHAVRFYLLSELANKPYIIRKPDYAPFHDGLPYFDFERVGELLVTNIGIVEPITQTLYFNMLGLPRQFEELYDNAKKNNKFQLLHRIYIAARSAVRMDTADHLSLPLCARIIREYEALIPQVIAYAVTTNADSQREIKRIETRIRALKPEGRKRGSNIRKPKKNKRSRK